MPRMNDTAPRYRLDMTEQEASVVRRLLEQAQWSDYDNRTAGTVARVVRRIQIPNLPATEAAPMTHAERTASALAAYKLAWNAWATAAVNYAPTAHLGRRVARLERAWKRLDSTTPTEEPALAP